MFRHTRVKVSLHIRNLQRKYDAQIKAEIICRRIELDKPYDQLKQKEKVDYLRLDEKKDRVDQEKAQDVIQPRDITYIVPPSAEMIALVATINRNN